MNETYSTFVCHNTSYFLLSIKDIEIFISLCSSSKYNNPDNFIYLQAHTFFFSFEFDPVKDVKKNMSTAIRKCYRSPLVHQQKKLCVDFVTELPYDIIPLIMKHFETLELFHLFQISKEWKTQLISCKSLWSKVIIHGDTHVNISVLLMVIIS